MSIKQKGKYTLTSTNGTLLNKELQKEILRSGLDKLIISFIGADKSSYEEIMRGAYFTDTRFGNIYKHDFNSIWHGKDYINFRKGLKGDTPMPVICQGCPWD